MPSPPEPPLQTDEAFRLLERAWRLRAAADLMMQAAQTPEYGEAMRRAHEASDIARDAALERHPLLARGA